MGMREDIENMKKEVQEIQEQSFASELLKDQKMQNKRLFIIILVILGMFTCLLGYTIYLLNDINTIETTENYEQDISDFESINNSTISNGGN